MPVDPFFLDKERRLPPEDVRPRRLWPWFGAAATVLLASLFVWAWFSPHGAVVFGLALLGLIISLFIWATGTRVQQDGIAGLFYERSMLTDIALGEHDRSAWPNALLALAILIGVVSGFILGNRHPQLIPFRTTTAQQPQP